MNGPSKSRGVEIIRYVVSAPAEAVAEVFVLAEEGRVWVLVTRGASWLHRKP